MQKLVWFWRISGRVWCWFIKLVFNRVHRVRFGEQLFRISRSQMWIQKNWIWSWGQGICRSEGKNYYKQKHFFVSVLHREKSFALGPSKPCQSVPQKFTSRGLSNLPHLPLRRPKLHNLSARASENEAQLWPRGGRLGDSFQRRRIRRASSCKNSRAK